MTAAGAAPHGARCAIGIDVGGTKVLAGLVGADGAVVRDLEESTDRAAGAGVDQALRLARQLAAHSVRSGLVLVGLGIGLPEAVRRDGTVATAAVVDWRDQDLGRLFAEVAPTTIEADVRCGALAEARAGAGRGAEAFLYVTVGTGVSACPVLAGRPWPGVRGNAGIVASSGMSVFSAEHGMVTSPPVEMVASGSALAHRYATRSGTPTSRAEEVLAAAAAGDAIARDVIETGGRALGAIVGVLVNMLDPALVVVGGGLGSAPGLFWETLLRSVPMHVWAPDSAALPIRHARLGDRAGMVGAALAALEPAA